MKGRAKVLDSRYLEFIEYLQKIGELQNIVRMIHSFSDQEFENGEAILTGRDQEKVSADKIIYSFWQMGWIEIRETDRKGKHKHGKEYALKISLEEIAEYFAQEKQHRFNRAGYPISRHDVKVSA